MKFDLVAEVRYEVEDAEDVDIAAYEAVLVNDLLVEGFPPSAAIRAELRYEKDGGWKVMNLRGKN